MSQFILHICILIRASFNLLQEKLYVLWKFNSSFRATSSGGVFQYIVGQGVLCYQGSVEYDKIRHD